MHPKTFRIRSAPFVQSLAITALLMSMGCASQAPISPSKPAGRALTARTGPPAPERGIAYPVFRTLDQLTTPATITPPPEGDGRIDSWRTESEIEELTRQAYRLPFSDAIQRQTRGEVDFTLGTHFDSIDVSECCAVGTLNPPDPDLAVGPEHVIATVNAGLEIYTLDGTSVFGPTPLITFFSGLPGNCTSFSFDPNALYDEDAGRFIVAADGDGASYCVAVSETSDPLDGWFFYDFAVNVDNAFFDYPHIGVSHDAIYVGANMFGTTFTGRVFALDKIAMYAGNPATSVTQTTSATPQPLKAHGASNGTFPTSGPQYILGGGGINYNLYSWDDPFGANVFTLVGGLNLGAAHGVTVGMPISNPQMGGANIAGNDDRGLDFELRNGSGWMAMHVSCNPGGGTVNCIQWAEIDLDTATVAQAGVFGTDGEYRYFPDIAVNDCGDALIGYTKSSTGSFPGVFAAGRSAADPTGTLQGEIEIKAGDTTANEPDRWGDYTSMSVSPDGKTLWYQGEYAKDLGGSGRNWGTYIGSVTFNGCQGEGSMLFEDGFESGDVAVWDSSVP